MVTADEMLQSVLRDVWDNRRTCPKGDDDGTAELARSLRADRLRVSHAAGHIPAAMEDAIVCNSLDRTLPFMRGAASWLRQSDRSILFLCGSVGAGKTVAAAWAIAECGGARFVTAHELLRVFGGRYGAPLQQQAEIRNAHMLVIDDAYRESTDDHKMLTEAFLEVFSARLNGRCRRTILTTNLPHADFKKLYKDDRLHSRLAQHAIVVERAGRDMRR